MALALLSAGFQSLPPLPTIKLGPSGADSQVRGLVHALGPCGSLQQTLLWGWEFLLLPPQPHRCFQSEVWGFISPRWSPGLRGLLHSPAVPPSLYMRECGAAVSASHHLVWSASCSLACPIRATIRHLTGSTSCHLAVSPLCPAARLHPSYRSRWMFLLYLLGCQTSIQFNFLWVLVVFCF